MRIGEDGMYPRIETGSDMVLEDTFFDADESQADNNMAMRGKEEQLPSQLPKVKEGTVSSVRSLYWIPSNAGKDLEGNMGLEEIICESQPVSPIETQTELDHERENNAFSNKKTDLDYGRENDTFTDQNVNLDNGRENEACRDQNLGRRYFYYDLPLLEETGVWIPVSVPPMSASDHEEWNRGLGFGGGYFPEEDLGWGQGKADQEMTLWTVLSEMLATFRLKVDLFTAGEPQRSRSPSVTNRLMEKGMLEQAWKEMAQTLTETTFSTAKDILEAEPPRWIADSAASACMLCNSRFHPFMCPRHHCRFCGGIFCGMCSRGRSLLPLKFRTSDPLRVCDVCWVRLESVQSLLVEQVSHAAQPAVHDVTDLSTLRSWMNFPWGQTMEHEIYKATNTLRGYFKTLRPERAIPDVVLRRAKGLAILTVFKVGLMVTYKVGTGLIIARKQDGSWSSPSAISSFGVGWGVQAGGELTDFMIVLRTEEAVKTFSGNIHFSIGAGLSAAAGPVGRVVEADLRAGDGGSAACYTYSCSKGVFVGCSLEGNVVATRSLANSQFYGNPSIKASDILLGSLPRPPAAAPLYNALSVLFGKVDAHCKP